MSERETEQPVAVLVRMIEVMLKRSEKYRREAEADGDLNDGEKHARVSSVLKELARLGKGLGAAAGDSAKAPIAERTAAACSADEQEWMDAPLGEPHKEAYPGWSASAKLFAIEYRFYQGQKWEPKVGDLYCLTRAGLTLCQIARWECGKIWHRTLVDDHGNNATHWPENEWTEEEFLRGGFMVNRCFVPPWAFPKVPQNAEAERHE